MTSKVSEAEISEFREIFNLVDRNGSGSITKQELSDLLETLGLDTNEEEIDRMFVEVDTDGSGEINFEEFLSVMSIKVNASHSADEIKKAFRIFEGNSPPGHVSAEKLVKSLLMYSSESLTKDQAQDLVNQLEIDENGLINYKSFVDMILS